MRSAERHVHMGKATTTIKHRLNYPAKRGEWFSTHQALFNRVVAFYFEVIQAHERVLELSSKEALTALEKLTHATKRNPHPIMPLSAIGDDIPAMFRRAAIHAALGSARSFYTHLKKWRARKEKAEGKGIKFTERPPVPPRIWNKSVTLYAGMWKGRTKSSLIMKVGTGRCWSWLKCHLTGRALPEGRALGSPSLVRHGDQWWLHTPVEKQFAAPPTIAQQVTTSGTKICSVDLNLDGHIAVCTVQTAEGTILSTRFVGGGRAISGFRKQQHGRIVRNRKQTGIIAEGEQENAALWRKILSRDESFAHLVSRRIVDFAQEQGATILTFEHLGNLKPTKGKYSKRGNEKRAYWMKGRIFRYAKYKAWNEGILTSRVRPRNMSRECARCRNRVARYCEGDPAEGYTPGAPLVLCSACGMRGNADRNASLVIGQRLIERYQGKPPTALGTESEEQSSGVIVCQEVKSKEQPSIAKARHADENGHGTARGENAWMDASSQLFLLHYDEQ
jgi:transposase